jgi:hypothetical protein
MPRPSPTCWLLGAGHVEWPGEGPSLPGQLESEVHRSGRRDHRAGTGWDPGASHHGYVPPMRWQLTRVCVRVSVLVTVRTRTPEAASTVGCKGRVRLQRRRFRFKLGTLMIAIAVVALVLAVMMPLRTRRPSVDPFEAMEMIGADKPPTKPDRIVPQTGYRQIADPG